MTVAACVLCDTAWLGIHYMPTPSVTLNFVNAANNSSAITNTIPGGATSWTILDGAGSIVGAGTCGATDTSITVASGGTFVGGGTVKPGYYTVYTNSGTNLVVAGNFCICPASTNLYVPIAAGDQAPAAAAWMSIGPDRDNSNFNGNSTGGSYSFSMSSAAIASARATDPYYTGPQDAARPHLTWVSSSLQGSNTPSTTQWAQLATTMLGAGYAGAWYECPTNEPEDGGLTNAQIITQWNAAAAAILAVDPTANVMGYCSGGIFNVSTTANLASFLAGTTSTLAAFTNHMENSHQNLGNIVMLREYIGAIQAQFVSSGFPHLPLWFTETGINGGVYNVLQPRREARQRTILEFVKESYGYPKESSYHFPVFDHQGSGIGSYLVDKLFSGTFGNMRAGAYALHIMSEALYGTTCNPANPPAKLSFGATGSLGDSLFAGSHYTAGGGDRVLLATNGLESATVTLAVSATGTLTYWDGWGVPSTATVTNGHVTIPVNDLLTYLFLPANTTVSVVDTDQSVVAMSSLHNMLNPSLASLVNESSAPAAGVVNNGSFSENGSGITGIAGPYIDVTAAGSLTGSTIGNPNHTFVGYALMGAGPPWQTVGAGLLTVTVTVGATVVDSYTCASAVSQVIPSGSNLDSSDPCTLTSFWNGCFSRAIKFSPVTGASMKVAITPSYGGQPDSQSSNNTTTSNLSPTLHPEGTPQQIQLAELEMLEPPFGGAFHR